MYGRTEKKKHIYDRQLCLRGLNAMLSSWLTVSVLVFKKHLVQVFRIIRQTFGIKINGLLFAFFALSSLKCDPPFAKTEKQSFGKLVLSPRVLYTHRTLFLAKF